MKKRIIEYPFHLGDLVGGTAHLENDEFGGYFRLLIAQIQSPEHELPNDMEQLRRFARCTPKAWARLWPLVSSKFTLTERGTYSHKRVENTIASIIHRSDVARDNRLKRKDTGSTGVKPSSNVCPANHITIEDISNDISSPLPPKGGEVIETKATPKSIMYGEMTFDQVFDYVWSKYPKIRDKGHKAKAKEKLVIAIKKGGKDAQDWRNRARLIAEGVGRYAKYCELTGEKNADAVRWFRDDGYQRDWTAAAGSRPSGRYSLEAVHDQAMGDKTGRSEGRSERLKSLGMDDDTGGP